MKKNIFLYIISIILLIQIVSCSSQPKRPTEINIIRRQAEQELEMANRAAGLGQFDNAILLINEIQRKAVNVDDVSLIIRVNLLHGNVLLSQDKPNEAITKWEFAIEEAERFNYRELLSVSRIYYARGALLAGKDTAQNVLETVIREQSNIRTRYYTALAWHVRGLALRSLESYNEAENAVRRSLEIYEKDRFLEEASFDWYLIASIRSLSGNFNGAIQALQASMAIDRRIENAWGLASSWRAMGDVFTRMGREQDAQTAYARSEAILRTMN